MSNICLHIMLRCPICQQSIISDSLMPLATIRQMIEIGETYANLDKKEWSAHRTLPFPSIGGHQDALLAGGTFQHNMQTNIGHSLLCHNLSTMESLI